MRTIPNTLYLVFVDKDGQVNGIITSTSNFVYFDTKGILIKKDFIPKENIKELVINGVVVIGGKGKDEQDKQNL